MEQRRMTNGENVLNETELHWSSPPFPLGSLLVQTPLCLLFFLEGKKIKVQFTKCFYYKVSNVDIFKLNLFSQ